MTVVELKNLTDEMKEEFQIPPYYQDMQLRNLAKEGEKAVGGLNPGCDISEDLTYRLWECVARNNPLASLLGAFDPNIFIIIH